jgi:replicative DNA helicase
LPEQKILPHDVDAEEAVNGSLLIDGKAIYDVAVLLQPLDFYSQQNGWIYNACLALYQRNEAINQITLAQELEREGRLEACGGAAYLSHLVSVVPTSLDIEHYARIVYRLSVMRQLISAADKISGIGYQADPDVSSSVNKAEDILYRLRHERGSLDFVHIKQVLDRYFEVPPSPGAEDYQPIPHALSGLTGLDDQWARPAWPFPWPGTPPSSSRPASPSSAWRCPKRRWCSVCSPVRPGSIPGISAWA